MIITLLFSLLLLVPDDPYVLVLTNNKKMKVQAPPQCSGRLCTVTLLNGEKTSIPSKLIDQAKTETFNREMAEEKEAMRLASEEAQRKEMEAQAKEPEKEEETKREIVLRAGDKLPEYDRSRNSMKGVVQPASANSEMIGEPRVRSFSSEDPVYIKTETITRFTDYYNVVCVLKTNVSGGVRNVKVQAKANFENGLPIEIEKQAGNLALTADSPITFKIKSSEELIQVRYLIDYETVE